MGVLKREGSWGGRSSTAPVGNRQTPTQVSHGPYMFARVIGSTTGGSMQPVLIAIDRLRYASAPLQVLAPNTRGHDGYGLCNRPNGLLWSVSAEVPFTLHALGSSYRSLGVRRYGWVDEHRVLTRRTQQRKACGAAAEAHRQGRTTCIVCGVLCCRA